VDSFGGLPVGGGVVGGARQERERLELRVRLRPDAIAVRMDARFSVSVLGSHGAYTD